MIGEGEVPARSPGCRHWFVWLPVLVGMRSSCWSFISACRPGTASAQSESQTDEGEPAGRRTDDGTTADQEAQDEALREGSAVYSQFCQACHQPGGVGLSGSYPPLIDNPNVEDADYVRDVIINGRQGELTVNGEVYNGVMPSFSTLADDDVDNLIAYIESGFQAPSGPAPETASGPVAGTELPALAGMGALAAYLIAALIGLMVVGPRLAARNDRLDTPWFDTWLKTAAIVIAIALAIAFIPNWVLQTSTVAGLARPLQELIGVGIWGLGLALCLGGMWYAHRESRL